ncbi:hypothetical protein C8Q79DRAFT_162535 [Trametes meyenii]|nr:hypothetical protein C8Q79DRAFT_162535 [Trametes meyenii]
MPLPTRTEAFWVPPGPLPKHSHPNVKASPSGPRTETFPVRVHKRPAPARVAFRNGLGTSDLSLWYPAAPRCSLPPPRGRALYEASPDALPNGAHMSPAYLYAASDMLHILRRCCLSGLQALTLEYGEDDEEQELLCYIAVKLPRLTTLKIRRYRNTGNRTVLVVSRPAIPSTLISGRCC